MTTPKIILLGRSGMLGQMVEHFFAESGFTVCSIDERYEFANSEPITRAVSNAGAGYVVNCIGAIPQRTLSDHDYFLTNTLLPIDLLNALGPGQFLIHPSTDCVFDGSYHRKNRTCHPMTANDSYGKSKRLAEIVLKEDPRAFVIRTSVIGPDRRRDGLGLLHWFLSHNSRDRIEGYTNHFWNGITTLQWCKILKNVITQHIGTDVDQRSLFSSGVLQVGTVDTYSKFELLSLFQSVFETNFVILPCAQKKAVNRTLTSDIDCPPLESQLLELREYPTTLLSYPRRAFAQIAQH